MKKIMISIITPVYNVRKYLSKCIDSILNQTFTNFELILVDDGSSDGSGEICDKYQKMDSRVHVIHQDNAGVSSARNRGINEAKGRFIAFCDSDDYCGLRWLEALYTAIVEQKADMVISGYRNVDENGNLLQIRKRCVGRWKINTEEKKIEYILKHVLDKKGEWNGWELWSSLFKREIIVAHNIRICEASKNFAEDLGFVLEFVLHSQEIVSIDCHEYFYVQHDTSMMARSNEIVKLDELNEVSCYFKKAYLSTIHSWWAWYQYSLIHFMIMNDQYEKIWYGEDTKRLPEEVCKIKNYYYYRKNIRFLFFNRRMMCQIYGRRRTYEYLLWNNFCRHLNWKRFSFESALVYKILNIISVEKNYD